MLRNKLIVTQNNLDDFTNKLLIEKPSFIAIDTEFTRQTSYWPIVSLIQIATPQNSAVIDMTANLNTYNLVNLIKYSSCTKVLHACKQDIEIFLLNFNFIPCPLFDIQIAAAYAGLGDNIGLDKLSAILLNKTIDKTHQSTDWTQRPLSDNQLNYALQDVKSIQAIYPILLERLSTLGRSNWPHEDFLSLQNPKNYQYSIEKLWLKLLPCEYTIDDLLLLKSLVEWRENFSIANNLNRSLVLNNNFLQHIILEKFYTIDSFITFAEKNNISGDVMEYAKDLYTLLSTRSLSDYNKIDSLIKGVNYYRKNFIVNRHALKNLKSKLLQVANDLNIPHHFIAKTTNLLQFLVNPEEDNPLKHGWRYEVFGQHLKNHC